MVTDRQDSTRAFENPVCSRFNTSACDVCSVVRSVVGPGACLRSIRDAAAAPTVPAACRVGSCKGGGHRPARLSFVCRTRCWTCCTRWPRSWTWKSRTLRCVGAVHAPACRCSRVYCAPWLVALLALVGDLEARPGHGIFREACASVCVRARMCVLCMLCVSCVFCVCFLSVCVFCVCFVCDWCQAVPRNISQAVLFAEADIVIMTHGAGMTNAPFMRPGGAVVQITGLTAFTRWLSRIPGTSRQFHYPIDRCVRTVAGPCETPVFCFNCLLWVARHVCTLCAVPRVSQQGLRPLRSVLGRSVEALRPRLARSALARRGEGSPSGAPRRPASPPVPILPGGRAEAQLHHPQSGVGDEPQAPRVGHGA
jgi:hypothetical protein